MNFTFQRLFILLLFLAITGIFFNLNTGFIELQWQDFFSLNSTNGEIAQLRINRVLVMFLAGISIPTSGFLLQEYFQNPLAGPSVLGISSFASLSVAFYIFFSAHWLLPEFFQNSFLSLSAIGGSFLLMLVLLLFSSRFQDKSFIIIFGFLVSALSGAIVSMLQFYAENQSLKNFVLWSFGANNQVAKNQLFILFVLIIIGLFFSFKCLKPLIGNSLGSVYAKSIGVNLKHLKYLIILSSSLLSASITAFLGPVLFIGIVVPHFSRLLFNPSKLWHQWILNMILGVCILEFFSIFSELSKLPLNIISSLFGIPVILVMLTTKKKTILIKLKSIKDQKLKIFF